MLGAPTQGRHRCVRGRPRSSSSPGAIGVVVGRNPVHSALMLVMTLFGVAVLFVAQEAHFLAAVQVIVYAGAIVVLFLFVIMLLGVDREEDIVGRAVTRAAPVAFALAAIAIARARAAPCWQGAWATGVKSDAGTVAAPAPTSRSWPR